MNPVDLPDWPGSLTVGLTMLKNQMIGMYSDESIFYYIKYNITNKSLLLVHSLATDKTLALPPRGTERKLVTLRSHANHAGEQTGCQKTESDTSGRSACTRLCTNVPWCNAQKTYGECARSSEVTLQHHQQTGRN